MEEIEGSAEIIDPGREIVEAHHHLWPHARMPADWPGSGGGPDGYRLPELYADLCTGHNVVQTVFAQCGANYRTDGPEHLRPVGETEWVAQIARQSQAGAGPEIAGIIAHADLTLGPAVEEVLDAHEAAGGGRLRCNPHYLARGNHRSGTEHGPGPAPPGLAQDEAFRAGVRLLGRRGLPYESWHYHYQMDEFIALARSVPDTMMVLDHFGTPVGVGHYRSRRAEVYAQLNLGMAAAAACRNVIAKLGGLAMWDNGFPWAERGTRATAEELVAAQRSYYLHAIDCFGPERCMFESNFPVDRVSVTYPELYNAFKLMVGDFSEADKDALFSGTARRVYRLPSPSSERPSVGRDGTGTVDDTGAGHTRRTTLSAVSA